MTEQQIISEVLRYIKDDSYNYAVLIDGEWGCGKTFFAKKKLSKKIAEQEQLSGKARAIKYISLYGCKSVADIQENIAWNFAENAQDKIRDKIHWKDKADTIVGNAVNTSRKIGNIILKKYLPEASVYEIAAEWLDLGAFIFLVDDLERCDCPTNEVFGFFNELVEHENTKVIFFANEKEISGIAEARNVEFQYLIAQSEKIEWPKAEESLITQFTRRPGNLLTFDELERRRSLLFPQKEANGEYRRVREKLIGETLKYEPDLHSIIPVIIANASCSADAKKYLNEEIEYFCNSMKSYKHCNLRTFQFFMSKISFLLDELEKIKGLDEEQRLKVLKRIVCDTFTCAVKYKSNYQPAKSSLDWLQDEQKDKSTFIKDYVECGKYDSDDFEKNILVLNEELSAFIDANDPFNIVYHDYYVKSQKECELALDCLAKRLEENKYPLSVYGKIIIGTQRMLDLGFSDAYMEKIKSAMLTSLKSMDEVKTIDPDLWYVDDNGFKNRVAEHINAINAAITNHTSKAQSDTVQELLKSDDWVIKLERYVNPNDNRFVQDIPVFAKAPVEQWVDVIDKATPETINEFRKVLGEIYPRDVHRKSFELDRETIAEIRAKLDEIDYDDLIKKASIGWLSYQLDEIIKNHEPLQSNTLG